MFVGFDLFVIGVLGVLVPRIGLVRMYTKHGIVLEWILKEQMVMV